MATKILDQNTRKETEPMKLDGNTAPIKESLSKKNLSIHDWREGTMLRMIAFRKSKGTIQIFPPVDTLKLVLEL